MPLDGLRVLSLESRRSAEIERLVVSQGGVPFVAPSMREVPLEQNSQAFEFAAKLLAPGGEFDMIIFLTGVGARLLNQVLETRYPSGSLAGALRRVSVVVRGSKPAAVMREWGVSAITVPEPNTWREILALTKDRPEKRVAVQEYGRPSQELLDGLRHQGREVTTVPVYQWDLPEDLGPLREAAHRLARGEFDVVLLTTSIQVHHLLKVGAQERIEAEVRRALERTVLASVGPTTSETLRELGLPPDFEPSHPKMGFLVNEVAARARQILQSKREREAR
jgi:uroporphyrinogen-III synthase